MRKQYIHEIAEKYTEMYNMLLTYAVCKLKNEDLAEEAVQDTFQIACQKPEALLGSPNPEGWIVNTLKNVLRNTVRNQNTARRILTAYLSAHAKELAAAADQADMELLYGDIIASEEFQLVKSITLDGRSYLDVARELGISVAACRKRVQRAREILKKKLEL